jgi:hypothetical protein
VGGTPMTTLRSTLRAVPDSVLNRMFDPANEDHLLFDETGAVFLDRDPEVFRLILDALRRGGRMVDTPEDRCLAKRLQDEADYFGLDTMLGQLVGHREHRCDADDLKWCNLAYKTQDIADNLYIIRDNMTD